MTEPGWFFGFLCNECGTGLPVERSDKPQQTPEPDRLRLEHGKSDVRGLVDNYGGGGKVRTRMLIEKKENHHDPLAEQWATDERRVREADGWRDPKGVAP